jgi:hypothetical protein
MDAHKFLFWDIEWWSKAYPQALYDQESLQVQRKSGDSTGLIALDTE